MEKGDNMKYLVGIALVVVAGLIFALTDQPKAPAKTTCPQGTVETNGGCLSEY